MLATSAYRPHDTPYGDRGSLLASEGFLPQRPCDREVTPLQREVTREVMVLPREVTRGFCFASVLAED